MPLPAVEADIEQGVLPSEILAEWNFDESRLACASNYIAGLLVFLFLAGVIPLSVLFLTSVLLVCLSTCIRAHVVHQHNARLTEAQGLSGLTGVIQALTGSGTSRGINLTSLRLSLVQRDFNELDYDALLALDIEVDCSKPRSISEEQIQQLVTFNCPDRSKGGCTEPYCENICCVCLDTFEAEAKATRLVCQHCFHSNCINPWLRQQGVSACCPLCKAEVWPRKGKHPAAVVPTVDLAMAV